MRPEALRHEGCSGFENRLLSVQNLNRGIGQRLIYIEGDLKGVIRAYQIHHAGEIRARDPADFSYRHPEFREANGLARLEKGVGLLISKQACLYFNVGAVVVRKRLAPI